MKIKPSLNVINMAADMIRENSIIICDGNSKQTYYSSVKVKTIKKLQTSHREVHEN